jgi:hypothetical protein
MIHKTASCFVGFLFLAAVSALAGAEPERATNEAELTAVVQASFEACRDAKWEAYAKLMDSRDLAEFKQKLSPILKAAPVNPTAPGNGLLDLFDGGKDLKTVAGWQPQEFFTRFMRGTTATTPLWQGNAGMKFKIVGVVSENADQAHAVVRVEKTMMTLKVTRMEVISLRRVAGADWRISLPEELRGLAETLSLTMFGPQPQVGTATAIDAAQPE